MAGICGMLSPIVIFTFLGLSLSQAPWFQWTQHALSNLGIKGVSAIFFNSGFILGGILTFIFLANKLLLDQGDKWFCRRMIQPKLRVKMHPVFPIYRQLFGLYLSPVLQTSNSDYD